MKDFQYAAPTTIQDATSLLTEHGSGARILAGGTDIIVQLREGLREADIVVDIKKIPELSKCQYSDESGLYLGAAVTCCDIYEDANLAGRYGALADSTHIIGGWQIQSRASVGGNLCNASPAADTIPALEKTHSLMANSSLLFKSLHNQLAWVPPTNDLFLAMKWTLPSLESDHGSNSMTMEIWQTFESASEL